MQMIELTLFSWVILCVCVCEKGRAGAIKGEGEGDYPQQGEYWIGPDKQPQRPLMR